MRHCIYYKSVKKKQQRNVHNSIDLTNTRCDPKIPRQPFWVSKRKSNVIDTHHNIPKAEVPESSSKKPYKREFCTNNRKRVRKNTMWDEKQQCFVKALKDYKWSSEPSIRTSSTDGGGGQDSRGRDRLQ